MKKTMTVFFTVLCILLFCAVCASAYENLDYTLEDGVLTVNSGSIEAELILPTPEMGEVDKIVIKQGAFCGNMNLTRVELTAKEEIYLGGAQYDFWEKDYYGCFECSGVESVTINTKHLDMSEGFVFYDCADLTQWECNVESFTDGYKNFLVESYYKTEFLPWIENENDYVYIGDTIIAYSGNKVNVFLEKQNISPCAFYGNENVKHIVMSDEWTQIPSVDSLGVIFSGIKNLETVKLSKNITQIPYGCFGGCEELKGVWLGNNIEKIGGLLLPWHSTVTFYYEGDEASWNEIDKAALDINGRNPFYEYMKSLEYVTIEYNCEDLPDMKSIKLPYRTSASGVEIDRDGNSIGIDVFFEPDESYDGDVVLENGDKVAVVVSFEKNGKAAGTRVFEVEVGRVLDGDICRYEEFEFDSDEYKVTNISILTGVDITKPIGIGNLGTPVAIWR